MISSGTRLGHYEIHFRIGVGEDGRGVSSEALSLVRELEDKYGKQQADATHITVIYAGMRDKDQVFAWLEKAFQDCSSLLVDLRVEFPFASFRHDPRFKDLLNTCLCLNRFESR